MAGRAHAAPRPAAADIGCRRGTAAAAGDLGGSPAADGVCAPHRHGPGLHDPGTACFGSCTCRDIRLSVQNEKGSKVAKAGT